MKTIDSFKEPIKRKHYNDNRSLIEEFFAASEEEMKIKWENRYESPYVCATSLNLSIERAGRKNQAKAVTRKGEVFMVKTYSGKDVVEPPKFKALEESSGDLKFIEVDPDVVLKKKRVFRSKNQKLLSEFLESGIVVANVPYNGDYSSFRAFSQSLRNSCNTKSYKGKVKVCQVDGHVYLVNLEKAAEHEGK